MAGRKLTALPSLAGKPADGDKFYVVDVSDTSESPQGTSKEVTYEELEIPTSGTATITPVITAGTGTCTDVTVSFFKIGGIVHFQFYTRTLTIPVGESSISLTVDLTGTGFEPSADFSGTGDVFGISRPVNVVDGANEMSSSSIEADLPKKIKIDVSLTANASGSDFSTSVSGSGSYSI
jgi:hypothetical protein